MSWLYYLLEANLYLAAFYLLYKLLLQNTTFYNANRYFLVLSIMVAFTIPFMQLGFLKPSLEITTAVQIEEVPQQFMEVAVIDQPTAWGLNDYLLYGYLALAIGLAAKFLFSISKIIRLYFNHQKREIGKYTLVELSAEHAAFSFFNVLFIHPSMVKNNAVLTHEMIHIKQKHSLDIILLELLKIICWFNPIVYLMKRDLTLLHEYIADESTTAKDISKHEYAMFLIENSMASYSPSLVNQFFNQSILKSRINMLNKEKTAKWARLKYLLAVPLGTALLCISTMAFTKDYGYVDLLPKKDNTMKAEDGKTFYPKNEYSLSKKRPNIVDKRHIVINGKPVSDVGKFHGVSQAESIVYLNAAEAVKKYGDKGKNGAVEITGDHLKYLELTPPPLPPTPSKQDQVKLPPTYKPKQQKYFIMSYKVRKKGGEPILNDKRLIVINGKPVDGSKNFYGVRNTESITFLNLEEGFKKYGEAAKFGVVEIEGSNLQYITKVVLSPPPAIEAPPKGKSLKKFPPPIVKADEKNETAAIKEVRIKGIEGKPTQIVEGIKIEERRRGNEPETLALRYEKYPQKKVEGIKLEKSKSETIKGEPVKLEIKADNPIKKVQGVKLKKTSQFEPGDKKKIENIKIEEVKPIKLKIEATEVPVKKVQGVKLGKAKSPATTTTKIALSQQLKTGYNGKAWLLYKPQPVEDKNDRC